MDVLINLVLFAMMVSTALAILRMRRLFAVVMLSGVFSLLSALLFVTLDAVDVAFTEAAVGAGISTVLMLGTMALTSREEKMPRRFSPVPLMVVLVDLHLEGSGVIHHSHSLTLLLTVVPIVTHGAVEEVRGHGASAPGGRVRG